MIVTTASLGSWSASETITVSGADWEVVIEVESGPKIVSREWLEQHPAWMSSRRSYGTDFALTAEYRDAPGGRRDYRRREVTATLHDGVRLFVGGAAALLPPDIWTTLQQAADAAHAQVVAVEEARKADLQRKQAAETAAYLARVDAGEDGGEE